MSDRGKGRLEGGCDPPRWPSEFLEYDNRIPPLTRPFCWISLLLPPRSPVCSPKVPVAHRGRAESKFEEAEKHTTPFPYKSLIALVANPTSSYSTKHIGPLIFCLKLMRLNPGLC